MIETFIKYGFLDQLHREHQLKKIAFSSLFSSAFLHRLIQPLDISMCFIGPIFENNKNFFCLFLLTQTEKQK